MKIKVKNLNKKINQKYILENISFDIDNGHILGLVGENGAGKTTIMKSILGMISINSGEVLIDEKQITLKNKKELKDVGSLIEYPAIYPFLTGYQHLKLFSKNPASLSDAKYLIDKLEMNSYIYKPANKYSLGMKQKLGILLALINKPKFVILDEPVNGLDPKGTKQVRELILEMKSKGVSFLISSHLLSELEKIIDDLVIIKNGKVIKKGSLDNFNENNSRILELTVDSIEGIGDLLTIKNNKILVASNKIQNAIYILNDNNIKILNVSVKDDDFEKNLLNILK